MLKKGSEVALVCNSPFITHVNIFFLFSPGRHKKIRDSEERIWEITELFDKPLKYSVSLMLDVDDAQLWTPDDKLVVYIDNRLVSIPYVFISTSFSVCHMVAILESS